MSDAVSSVTSWVGDAASSVGNFVSNVGQDIGSGLASADKALGPGGWTGLAALAAAPFSGGASLALDAEAVAAADATAAGLGYSSAAEAIQAGAITAEGLGLPAAATAADLAAVSGSASAGFSGLGAAGSAAGGVAGGASQFTPQMLAAAQQSSDPIGMLSYLSGATPEEIQAATGAGAQASGLSQALGYAKTGADIIGGVGKLSQGIQGISAGKQISGLQADPYAQYRSQAASQLQNLLMNPQSVTQTPGYQFNLSQGLQGLQAQQAAQGRLVSGGALLQGQQYGQQLASQTYQQQLSNLSTLSGANQSPAGASQAQAGNILGGAGAQNYGLQSIAGGIGGIVNPLQTLYSQYNSGSPSA
jgi:hypothetical protein